MSVAGSTDIEDFSLIYSLILRRRMKGKRAKFLEYVWLRKFVHGQRCNLFVPDMNSGRLEESTTRNYNVSYMTAFSFLEAVREHKSIEQVEEYRKGPSDQPGRHTYNHGDALKYSILYGHTPYAEYLLENHLEDALLQNVCCPLLLLAVRLTQPQMVDMLCRFSGRKKRHNSYINKPGCSAMECGRTALHIAAETGNLEITKVLIKYGADTQIKDDFGRTALNRILYRIRPPHINHLTVQCALELLKCEQILAKNDLDALENLIKKSNTDNRVCVDFGELGLKPGPFSLQHMTRVAIRSSIGYPNLPDIVLHLGLPASLQQYIRLETKA